MRNVALTTVTLMLLAACAYPTEQVRTLDERPSIQVVGAPYGAAVWVDGQFAGPANAANGVSQAIRIEPGTHAVVVNLNDRALTRETVFVSGNIIKTITVPARSTAP